MSSYPCNNPMCTSRQGVFSTYKGLEMHLGKSRECQQFYCQPLSNIEYSIGNCQHKRTKLSPTRTNNQPVAASPILPASPTFLPARISSTDTPIAVQASMPSPSLDYFDLPSSDPFFADQEPTKSASTFTDPDLIHTNEQKCLIDLMKLVHDLNTPDYAFELILKWAQTAYMNGFNFRPSASGMTRASNIDWMMKMPQNAAMRLPYVLSIPLEKGKDAVAYIYFDVRYVYNFSFN